jgi:microsomal dipeptidase-like Zn-dependent dipeptidase
MAQADATYVGKLKQSGVSVVNHTVAAEEGLVETLRSIHNWWNVFARFPDELIVAREFADIARAKSVRKVAVFLGFQNTSPLEGKLFLLDVFRALGIRIMQLTYQRRNLVGDGCGERTNSGLSKFGTEVVKHMNELGIVIDLSHVGGSTTLDAIELSKHPVVITHSTVRRLCDTVRGKTDEEIKALAARGGVIGIAAKSGFLRPNGAESGTTIDDYIDHIDYVRDLVGADYVGIGTDVSDERGFTKERMAREIEQYPEFRPVINSALQVEFVHPRDLDSPGKLFNITVGLVRRGYSEDDILKILGVNFLRVFSAVMGE